MVNVAPPDRLTALEPEITTLPETLPPAPPLDVTVLAKTLPRTDVAPPDRASAKFGARIDEPVIVFTSPNESGRSCGPFIVMLPLIVSELVTVPSSGLATTITPSRLEPPLIVTWLGASISTT